MELDNILNKVRQDIYDMYNKGSIDIFSISSKVKNNDVPFKTILCGNTTLSQGMLPFYFHQYLPFCRS